MELISVIVPVYNVEQYLMRCVDSIRAQTYQNLEIILVDDGSPDNCPEICETIKAQDCRIKVVHKENGGLGFARNSGLDVATGTYVTFIDSDDWISKNHIENLYQEIKRVNADVVIGSHSCVSSAGNVCEKKVKLEQRVYEEVDIKENIVLPLIGADLSYPQDIQLDSSSCMNLYRTAVIANKNIRFRSEKQAVAEDVYFNIDFFCNAERITVLNETGYFYFENAESISRRYDPKRFDRTICFYDVLKRQIEQYGLESIVAWRAERTFLLKIRVLLRLLVLSDIPRKEIFKEIRRILNHPLVKKVLLEYPVDSYIPAMRILVKMMRSGNAWGVYWMIKLREYGKNVAWLKMLLKQIGIGK